MSMNRNGMKNFTLRWNLNAIVKIRLDAIEDVLQDSVTCVSYVEQLKRAMPIDAPFFSSLSY